MTQFISCMLLKKNPMAISMSFINQYLRCMLSISAAFSLEKSHGDGKTNKWINADKGLNSSVKLINVNYSN